MWQQPNLTSLPSRSSRDNSVLFDFLLDLLRNDETGEAVPEVDDDVRVCCRDNPVTEESSVAISGDRDDDDDDGIVSSLFFSQVNCSSPSSGDDVIDSSATFFEAKNFTIKYLFPSCENVRSTTNSATDN